MGVSLDPGALMAGYRPAVFKQALRAYSRRLDRGALIDLRSLFPLRRDGAIVFEEALDRGLIDPSSLKPTAAGEVLARARMRPRTAIERADVILGGLLERVEAINADEDEVSRIDQVWLFGSMLRREPTVGDIDLAVRSSRRPRFRSDHELRGRHVDERFAAAAGAPQDRIESWDREDWLASRALHGPRRHPLLAGVQAGTSDLQSLGVPCRLLFDRERGGRVDDPILPRHPASTGRDPDLDGPSRMPDLTPTAIRPMDGRWIAGHAADGEVWPYDIFRGWTPEAHTFFGTHPAGLRILTDGHSPRRPSWLPRRLQRGGLDGRSSVLLADTTAPRGISLALGRRVETLAERWELVARFEDVELQRSRGRPHPASLDALTGATALILATDAERMKRRAAETSDGPAVAIRIHAGDLPHDLGEKLAAPVTAVLASRGLKVISGPS